ncbi:hypothetical protein FC20_GL000440 [Lactobacillus equicursoris DSM 19284 = JCM 14600 = CIP 110162]|uniref:Uncharacterized protein n=2 Tax=Lactobacillus equicursoris TaxID=420645 RepID=A0A0R1MCW8_9LACO|nr:hypothetical protein FC20_GL000440 [Lactobacillus equicursoris DSM 19284 = JCM 14600 = CIP 110162]
MAKNRYNWLNTNDYQKARKKKMGLTFKRQDDLEKMFDKFASIPDPKKDAGKGKGDEEEKQEKGKQKPKK